jgi:curved DNA-binding protein CbpA
LIDENVAPTPKSGVDFSSLSPSPTPEQYFLLSRLDGSLTVAELCKISGLGRQKTLDALESLALAGAIALPGFEVPAEQGASSSVAETTQASPSAKRDKRARKDGPSDASAKKSKSSKTSTGSKKKKVTPNYPTPIEAFDFDQRLLELDVPLDDQHRRELICLYSQLDQMTFYDIFGVDDDAKKRDIKKAYFRMSKRYHPDKHFRKDLADIGPMLETVFKEITKAYRTLSSKSKREDYDSELAAHLSKTGQTSSAAKTSSQGEPLGGGDSSAAEQNRRKAAAVLLMRRAEKLQKQERFVQAAAEYRKALALNRDADLAVRVARMLLDSAELPEEASSFARAALKLGADEAISRFMIGRAKEACGAAEAAVQEYRRVLLASPGHAGAKARLDELDAEP